MSEAEKTTSGKKRIDRIIALLAVVIAGFSFWIAWQSKNANERIVQVSTYMELRKNFKTVIKDIPYELMHKESPAPSIDTNEWKLIQNYWYSAFDEWYITTQLNEPSLQALWNNRYKGLHLLMLEKNAFREVLCYLIHKKGITRSTKFEEYGKVMQEIYRNKSNNNLCSLKNNN